MPIRRRKLNWRSPIRLFWQRAWADGPVYFATLDLSDWRLVTLMRDRSGPGATHGGWLVVNAFNGWYTNPMFGKR